MFQKAIKRDAKGRVALVGPAGSGKSFTMLKLARLLAGPHGKIAAIDTEHGSLSKYADLFDFDVVELDSFSPENFLDSLEAAQSHGYAVFCCDSLSHFWVGKGGALEFVDMANKRQRDQMGGWKDWRPHERQMIDAMIAASCHVICTMRTKNEYVAEEKMVGGQKKTVRTKVGLAPVQREGMEYEFDLVGTMTDENDLIIDKTRCPHYSGQVINKPGDREFGPFLDWLKGSLEPKNPPAQQPSAPSSGNGPAAAASAGSAPATGSAPVPPGMSGIPEVDALWTRMGKSRESIIAVLQELHSDLCELCGNEPGEAEYQRISKEYAGGDPTQKVSLCRRVVLELYKRIESIKRQTNPAVNDDDVPTEIGGQKPLMEISKEPAYAD